MSNQEEDIWKKQDIMKTRIDKGVNYVNDTPLMKNPYDKSEDAEETGTFEFDPSRDPTSKFYSFKLNHNEKPSFTGAAPYKSVDKEGMTEYDIRYVLVAKLGLKVNENFQFYDVKNKDGTIRPLEKVLGILSSSLTPEQETGIANWLPLDLYETEVEPPQPGSSQAIRNDCAYEKRGLNYLARTWIACVEKLENREDKYFSFDPKITL